MAHNKRNPQSVNLLKIHVTGACRPVQCSISVKRPDSFTKLNPETMEPLIVCQEILITPDSAFFAKEYQDLLHTNQQQLSQKQLLAEACWNGLLKLSLPEILPELELVNINEGDRILDLRFGKTGHSLDSEFSLNPYLFLNSDRQN